MPELPRLDQFAPIAVTPRPTPNPQVSGMVSGTVAQGAGQMEQILGHITAKDIELQKHERAVQDRLDAENAVHTHFESMSNEIDSVRAGQATYENYLEVKAKHPNGDPKTGPIQPDDLMAVYGHIQNKHLEMGSDTLGSNFGKYAFANEFNQRSLSLFQRLHTERDQRKQGELQGKFAEAERHDLLDVGSGEYDVNDTIAKYKDRASRDGFIFGPNELRARMDKHIKDIRMEPYVKMINEGKATDLIQKLYKGEVKGLTGEEKLDLEKTAHEANWRNMSAIQSKYEMDKRNFRDGSEKILNERFPMVTRGMYTFQHLENDAQILTKEDHATLFSMLEIQSKAGGRGNGQFHANAKFAIGLDPEKWDTDRVKSYVELHGLNPIEGVDLLNELSKAKMQQRNRENDPNHFSKDHQFKMYYQGLEKDLGVSPFSVLKPQDQHIVEQAKHDYYNTFQLPYDAKKSLPDFEKEYLRITNRYKTQMSWELEDITPYKSLNEIRKDFDEGKISKTRAIELGTILKNKEDAARRSEAEKVKE